ncbi:hypothetical protein SAMN05421759_1027 [Roseivivax lentus]|uniref:Uncharacterized protein n=1 Tax=Roseivivax lentus TaxID=633194 RepID=A0A1N7KRS4_9RHOB|nr:hypothetical protein SAMN05421759_1027 [Roseivivax lentus]
MRELLDLDCSALPREAQPVHDYIEVSMKATRRKPGPTCR